RVHRRGRQDCAAGEGDGESQLPARPRSESAGDREADESARRQGGAERSQGRCTSSARRTSVASRARWSDLRRREVRAALGIWKRAGDNGRGWLDSGGGRLRTNTRRAGATRRVWLAGGERSRA